MFYLRNHSIIFRLYKDILYNIAVHDEKTSLCSTQQVLINSNNTNIIIIVGGRHKNEILRSAWIVGVIYRRRNRFYN